MCQNNNNNNKEISALNVLLPTPLITVEKKKSNVKAIFTNLKFQIHNFYCGI